jgi:hypothetical protein
MAKNQTRLTGVTKTPYKSTPYTMSKVNKKWLRLANKRPQPWPPHMTDDSKIAQVKREASGQAPPSRKPNESRIKPKPGIGAGGTRRTRRKGVKVYARKRRGSAYSLKSAFNF